jgi:hypothetical protein
MGQQAFPQGTYPAGQARAASATLTVMAAITIRSIFRMDASLSNNSNDAGREHEANTEWPV